MLRPPYSEELYALLLYSFPYKTVEAMKIELLYSMAPIRGFSLCYVTNAVVDVAFSVRFYFICVYICLSRFHRM